MENLKSAGHKWVRQESKRTQKIAAERTIKIYLECVKHSETEKKSIKMFINRKRKFEGFKQYMINVVVHTIILYYNSIKYRVSNILIFLCFVFIVS